MKKRITISVIILIAVFASGLAARANSSVYLGAGYGLGPVSGTMSAFTHGISVFLGGEVSVDEYTDTIFIIEASGFFPIGAVRFSSSEVNAMAPSAAADALIGAGGRFQIGNSLVTLMLGGGVYMNSLFTPPSSGTRLDFGIGAGLTADMRYEISDSVGIAIGIRPSVAFIDIRYEKSQTTQTLSASSSVSFSLIGRAVIAFKF